MTKLCPVCGCPLIETTWNRHFCPICQKIIEEEKPEEDSDKSYIG